MIVYYKFGVLHLEKKSSAKEHWEFLVEQKSNSHLVMRQSGEKWNTCNFVFDLNPECMSNILFQKIVQERKYIK